MKVEQIIFKPITTPEYPDPPEARRYICDDDGVYGYDYVFLEDATWNALGEIARERGCMVDELCSDIELNFAHGEPFAPAARRYLLRYIADIPDNIELPGNFRVLRANCRPQARAMTEKPAAPLAPDAELAEKIARFKRGMQARIAEIKRGLVQWLDQTTSSADHVEASAALLDLACDRYLDLHDEEDTRDFIEKAVRRAVQRRRGPLQ
jgi:predicted DNA-binding ribbon-helix-helix protein